MKKVEVFGSGCAKCKQTEKIVQMAADELDLQIKLQKVTSISEISARGVMMTPAVAIDGKVVVSGKVPNLEEMKRLLSQ